MYGLGRYLHDWHAMRLQRVLAGPSPGFPVRHVLPDLQSLRSYLEVSSMLPLRRRDALSAVLPDRNLAQVYVPALPDAIDPAVAGSDLYFCASPADPVTGNNDRSRVICRFPPANRSGAGLIAIQSYRP